jgi:hypothetical protein
MRSYSSSRKIAVSISFEVTGFSSVDLSPRPVTGIALLYGDGVCFL